MRALTLLLTLLAGPALAQPRPCGLSPRDWCAAPTGDPCGQHRTEAACRADARCQGRPYRGESFVACQPDGQGFWRNCPAVGCISRNVASGQDVSPSRVQNE